jgi:hypothetical protein
MQIEIGNYDSFYEEGIEFSSEQVNFFSFFLEKRVTPPGFI